MKSFIKPNFKVISENKEQNNCIIEISPLEKGLGYTLGNSLRRVLLSFIPGIAVYGIKIKKVMHEFSTIKGVVEDVPTIILNIKNLVLKTSNIYDENVWKNSIKLNLENVSGEIYAKDIVCPMGIEVVNPDLYIATAAKSTDFAMEIYAGVNHGYSTFSDNKHLNKGIANFISIDSDYSPVKNVSLNVEQILVGKTKDLEKLELNITTNGCMTGKEAIAFAGKMLNSYFINLIEWSEKLEELDIFTEEIDNKQKPDLDLSLNDLSLSVRALNSLKKYGIDTLEGLLNLSKDELAGIKNMGSKTVEEIINILAEHNLELASNS